MKKRVQRKRELYVGIDTHKNSYTIITYDLSDREFVFEKTIKNPTYDDVIDYVDSLEKQYDEPVDVTVGYEAGYIGYDLLRYIRACHLRGILLAPQTIKRSAKEKRMKTDRRDARLIAKSLAHFDYSEVYIPNAQDEAVRDTIRQRESTVASLKRLKQQIQAFLNRRSKFYDGRTKTKWTQDYLKWLRSLKFEQEADEYNFQEMLKMLGILMEKVKNYDKYIEAIAEEPIYQQRVRSLKLIRGISTLIALAVIVEVGDFRRFAKAGCFASFLGLTPAQHASGSKDPSMGITKQGNKFLRKLLIQAAQAYSRKSSISKPRAQAKLEAIMAEELVNYAQRAEERIRYVYTHLLLGREKPHQKVKCAVARELACFIWGMMTDHVL